jgi:hypothetical protein
MINRGQLESVVNVTHVGVAMGGLIGIITGVITLLILRDAFQRYAARRSWFEQAFGRRQVSGIRLATRMSSLPMLWFGAPWLSTVALAHLDWTELLPVYLVAVAISYLLVVAFPIVRLIIKVGRDIQ